MNIHLDEVQFFEVVDLRINIWKKKEKNYTEEQGRERTEEHTMRITSLYRKVHSKWECLYLALPLTLSQYSRNRGSYKRLFEPRYKQTISAIYKWRFNKMYRALSVEKWWILMTNREKRVCLCAKRSEPRFTAVSLKMSLSILILRPIQKFYLGQHVTVFHI